MRGDLALVKPCEKRPGIIGCIGCQTFGHDPVAFLDPVQHSFGSFDLLRHSRGCCLDIDNDGMSGVDHVVSEVTEAAAPFLGVPCGGGIGWR
jgi:hypothetical protein